VDVVHRPLPTDEAVLGAQRGRHRVGDAPHRRAPQDLLDPGPVVLRVQLRLVGLGVERDDPTGLVAGEVQHHVLHLALAPEALQLAEEDEAHARVQLALPPRLVEEGHRHRPRAVAHPDVDQGLAAAQPAHRHLVDGHEERGLLTLLEVPDRRLAGPVEVTTGVVGQQVEQRDDAEVPEPLGLRRADPLEGVDLHAVEVDQRERRVAHRSRPPICRP
jgi:hypothetical protein